MNQNKINEHNEPQALCSFLSSSLNVELVYVILTSVVAFVKDRQFWTDEIKRTRGNNTQENSEDNLLNEISYSTQGSPSNEKSFHLKSKFKGSVNPKTGQSDIATPRLAPIKQGKVIPNVLTLPSIKLQMSRKFWESNKDIN